MISINTPKTEVVIDNLNGKEIDGVKFELVRIQGMSVIMHTSNDSQAKEIVKKVITPLPEMKYKMLTISILDDNGRLI